MIYSNFFYNYIKCKKISSKNKTHKIESGYEGLTNYFLNKGLKIFVINSDKKKFSINDFHNSETFGYIESPKYLISDRHIRSYDKLSLQNKKRRRKQIWNF